MTASKFAYLRQRAADLLCSPVLCGLAIFAAASPAYADPCKAPLPAKDAMFTGVVRYVGDGDSLCVGPKGRPNRWVEVRLGDFYAPELHARGGALAKRRLVNLALGQPLICRAGRRSYDRIVAWCTLRGRPLGALLRGKGGAEGGRGWHP